MITESRPRKSRLFDYSEPDLISYPYTVTKKLFDYSEPNLLITDRHRETKLLGSNLGGPTNLACYSRLRVGPEFKLYKPTTLLSDPRLEIDEIRPEPRRVSKPYLLVQHRSQQVKSLVECFVGLLYDPVGTLPRTAVEFVCGLEQNAADQLARQVSLAEAVPGMTGIMKEAMSSILFTGLEGLRISPTAVLVGAEVISGLVAVFILSPLVAPLKVGAELINLVSILLPAGEVRTWTRMDDAQGWTEKAIVHGLSDVFEPYAGAVSIAAGVGLSLIVALSHKSEDTRSRIVPERSNTGIKSFGDRK
jgi:hypothetical protein